MIHFLLDQKVLPKTNISLKNGHFQVLLLMDEISHQLIWYKSHYSHWFDTSQVVQFLFHQQYVSFQGGYETPWLVSQSPWRICWLWGG